ncbi:5319_t:CDS:2 [Diversispora eburnea]|uniref:5319_t:CDS:1 n=1 Tax=Diversispora eburnea TaxID=1213867 RepID=A0A9N8ZZ01_9GLOM|nr:5319_t:CDS:2 [Diversispora eburnea]
MKREIGALLSVLHTSILRYQYQFGLKTYFTPLREKGIYDEEEIPHTIDILADCVMNLDIEDQVLELLYQEKSLHPITSTLTSELVTPELETSPSSPDHEKSSHLENQVLEFSYQEKFLHSIISTLTSKSATPELEISPSSSDQEKSSHLEKLSYQEKSLHSITSTPIYVLLIEL